VCLWPTMSLDAAKGMPAGHSAKIPVEIQPTLTPRKEALLICWRMPNLLRECDHTVWFVDPTLFGSPSGLLFANSKCPASACTKAFALRAVLVAGLVLAWVPRGRGQYLLRNLGLRLGCVQVAGWISFPVAAEHDFRRPETARRKIEAVRAGSRAGAVFPLPWPHRIKTGCRFAGRSSF